MSTGIRAWDVNGNLILDLTDRITKQVYAGSITLPAGVDATTVSAPDLVSDDSWMVVASSGCYIQYGSGSFVLRRSTTYGAQGFPLTVTYAVMRR